MIGPMCVSLGLMYGLADRAGHGARPDVRLDARQ